MTNSGATFLLPGLPSVGDVKQSGRARFAPRGSLARMESPTVGAGDKSPLPADLFRGIA